MEAVRVLDSELRQLDARRTFLLARRAWLVGVLYAPVPAPIAPPSGPEAPLTPAERQVDALLARSPVWRRIQGAIASALAAHPAAAAAVARALREVSL